jgi:hypothetical protein
MHAKFICSKFPKKKKEKLLPLYHVKTFSQLKQFDSENFDDIAPCTSILIPGLKIW